MVLTSRVPDAVVALTSHASARQLASAMAPPGNPQVQAAQPAVPYAGGADQPQRSRETGLLLIACFKLFKTVFFLLVGLGVLHLIHRDLSEVILHAASYLHLDADGQIVGLLLLHAHLISGHQLRVAGVLSILYACVAAVEGTGLLLQKTWAEYLTLGLTLAALPWEVVEIVRHTTWLRFGLLAVNLLVVMYLVWFLRRSRSAWSHSPAA